MEQKIGDIAYVSNSQSAPLYVNVGGKAIKEIRIRVTGSCTVAGGGDTLLEDGVLRVLQRIQVMVGGKLIKNIGNGSATGAAARLLNTANRYLFGYLPSLTQPVLTAGANSFSFIITIPFALPSLIYGRSGASRLASCLQSKAGELISIVLDWGDLPTDCWTLATETANSANAEIVAVLAEKPVTPSVYYKENTQVLPIALAANTAEELQLNRNGVMPYLQLMNQNTGALNDAVLTNLSFRRNNNDVIKEQSFAQYIDQGNRISGLQGTTRPTGQVMVFFDTEGDGQGALKLDNPLEFESFKVIVNHTAYTTSALLIAHAHYLQAIGR